MGPEADQPLPREDLDDLQARVGELWVGLEGGRLFLTGCTGFFGAWLVEGLLAAVDQQRLRVQAVLLTRDPKGFRQRMPHIAGHPAISLHAGDVRTFEPPEGQFTHLIHGATTPSATLNSEQPRLMLETILGGTQRVLEAAARMGIQNALFVSSGAVYGLQPTDLLRIPEDYAGAADPMDPQDSYGLGKRLAEHLCRLTTQESGMAIRIARCFAFLGPQQPLATHQAASSFLRDALAGEPVRVSGDGTAVRSWLYGKDLAWWLWTILLKGSPGRTYNVGSEQAVDISTFANLVASAGGTNVQITGLPVPGRPPHRYVPDTTRARLELDLDVSVSLEDAIRRTIQWNLRAARG